MLKKYITDLKHEFSGYNAGKLLKDILSGITVAAVAVLEVEGVCGLASNLGYDIAEMLGKKTLAKGIRLSTEGEALRIDCEIVAQFGQPVFVLARNVQEHVKSCVESLTGLSVAQVNVNVSGIALPREGKK